MRLKAASLEVCKNAIDKTRDNAVLSALATIVSFEMSEIAPKLAWIQYSKVIEFQKLYNIQLLINERLEQFKGNQ